MWRHRLLEPSARNLMSALNTVMETLTEDDIKHGDLDVLVAGMPVLNTGEPHLANRSHRYRRAAKIYRQYLEEMRDGLWSPQIMASVVGS